MIAGPFRGDGMGKKERKYAINNHKKWVCVGNMYLDSSGVDPNPVFSYMKF